MSTFSQCRLARFLPVSKRGRGGYIVEEKERHFHSLIRWRHTVSGDAFSQCGGRARIPPTLCACVTSWSLTATMLLLACFLFRATHSTSDRRVVCIVLRLTPHHSSSTSTLVITFVFIQQNREKNILCLYFIWIVQIRANNRQWTYSVFTQVFGVFSNATYLIHFRIVKTRAPFCSVCILQRLLEICIIKNC